MRLFAHLNCKNVQLSVKKLLPFEVKRLFTARRRASLSKSSLRFYITLILVFRSRRTGHKNQAIRLFNSAVKLVELIKNVREF